MLAPLNKANFYYQLNRFTTVELENLIEKFPYFQEAHLLLAKKYQQEKHPLFDQQLQLAVLYTQDRELFYTVFNGKEKSTVTAPLTSTSETIITTEKPTPLIPQHEQEEQATLEKQSIESDLNESSDKPVIDEAIVRQLIVLPTEETPEQDAFSIDTFHTFQEWLKAYSHRMDEKIEVVKVENQEPDHSQQQKQDEELEKLYLTNMPVKLQELVEEETNYSKGLDKFIEEQIQKHKPLTAAKPFSENEIDPQLVTETMAKVYEMQKKYAKAIDCYKLLALKFPKKNDFFAARINFLQNII